MITVTPSAGERIAQQLQKHNAQALRFGVKESGCSGYSYVMDFAFAVDESDTLIEQHGARLVVDPESLKILSGTEIDFVSEGLNQTFKFRNPKATDECGCGESFAHDA